jgi:hypothetical protein
LPLPERVNIMLSCVDNLRAQGTLFVELGLCASALRDSLTLLRVQKLLVSAVSMLPISALLTLHTLLLPADRGSCFNR